MPTVSRAELYEQVWKRPLIKVAADYNITGTGLKKICARHEIPTPERGYWAKLQHRKPVRHPPLPDLSDERLAKIHIMGAINPDLSKEVTEAKTRVREKLAEIAKETTPSDGPKKTADEATADVTILSATLRTIRKARPDGEGFVSAKGRGVVPLRIGPPAIERGIALLAQFFSLAGTQGYIPKAIDDGLVLVIDDEPVTFALETPVDRNPHQPTPAELKEQERNARWNMAREPWPKYDYFPSERLSIVIHANAYSGLRRKFSDRRSKPLEQKLPTVLEAFAQHAVFAKERRLEQEEGARQFKEAERLRQLEEAFDAREKHRIEFFEAVHQRIAERQKLVEILAHLNSAADPKFPNAEMIGWLRRRIDQLSALISPAFLNISARAAKVEFAERPKGTGIDPYVYHPPVSLQYWSIDDAAGQARSISALQWIKNGGLLSSAENDERPD
ncbi:hypothetical protein [Mesorhizobium sp. B2-7-1]|uniref:hypothetical protein n=1 Tax=Mesorhizobium sp. B2-7-1 TaxID=2589909 RepID=UPI001125B455|nr:hypothetical protein [Mesorhizobium sp. B2-7-1]TPJ73055.1 hypothetical protein FJ471_05325 [Mesorhizobium sp. B2-7-1]